MKVGFWGVIFKAIILLSFYLVNFVSICSLNLFYPLFTPFLTLTLCPSVIWLLRTHCSSLCILACVCGGGCLCVYVWLHCVRIYSGSFSENGNGTISSLSVLPRFMINDSGTQYYLCNLVYYIFYAFAVISAKESITRE